MSGGVSDGRVRRTRPSDASADASVTDASVGRVRGVRTRLWRYNF